MDMTALDRTLPIPRLLERDGVDLAIPCDRAWEIVRHGDLARSKLVHALFALRTLPSRLMGQKEEPLSLRIDDLESSVDRPGFQVLADEAPHEVVVGAIGKVWEPDIPFVHVPDAKAFASFSEPGFIKVAWAIQLSPQGSDTHVAIEVRVDATDEESWQKFRSYFRLIGPGSHFIRHAVLAALAREHGTPESKENARPMLGDELLPDAIEQVTHGITIAATPEAIWPWLVQMGCHRAGFYAVDLLDNAGVPSAREIHPELQRIAVGDVLPATSASEDGFQVLRIEPNQALVLGGLFDPEAGKQLPFSAARPAQYWHVTWAFILEPLDAKSTRLHARGRAAFPESGRVHATWTRYVHGFMQTKQLRHLAARVEGRLPRDNWREVAQGVGGAAIMTAAFLTPFMRSTRNRWGLSETAASRSYPGDELISDARWSWTHGIEIDAPPERVWPWIAQIGADRGGFYSYQWLENVAGCDLKNAETVHEEWALKEGEALRLHPEMPPLRVISLLPGRSFVAYAPADAVARAAGKPWAETTWLFYLEPLEGGRSRFISRFRCNYSGDLTTQLSLTPTLLEPIGFAMDRRMLKGVKERAERTPVHLKTMSGGS
jgi:hypothetical protein